MVRRGAGGSRTVATVFVTDMVGSTELAARVGDRRWRELLLTYRRAVRDTVGRSGGRVVDHAGDGVLVVFDQPAGAID